MNLGYYTHPTLYKNRLIFISEEDLWSVPITGGHAIRLTAGHGAMMGAHFSPDGKTLAISSEQEGSVDLYLMPSDGGELERLTYLGCRSFILGWDDNKTVFFLSDFENPHSLKTAYKISIDGGLPESLNLGPVSRVNCSPFGVVIERNTLRADPAFWKRYRGGSAGSLWVSKGIDDEFNELIKLKSNLSSPFWIKNRIYFLSDHEGISNIYSILSNGADLKKHTFHQDFYVRNPSSDGEAIVYQAGGELFYLSPSEKSQKIEILYHSQRPQRHRKYVSASDYLETAVLHPEEKKLCVTTRGQVHTLGAWSCATLQWSKGGPVRSRLSRWLHDGMRIILVSDEGGEERFEIHFINGINENRIEVITYNMGRVVEIKPAPTKDWIAFTNHRNELYLVDLIQKKFHLLAQDAFRKMSDFSWSPDSNWLAFSASVNATTNQILLCRTSDLKIFPATPPSLGDFSPIFDPEGKYLYFLSVKVLNPVAEWVRFDFSFQSSIQPCLLTLQNKTLSPFLTDPNQNDEDGKSDREDKESEGKKNRKVKEILIDTENIFDRIAVFPLKEGCYFGLRAIKNKIFFLSTVPTGSLNHPWLERVPQAEAHLEYFDIKEKKRETLVRGVTSFDISQNGERLLLRIGNQLRIIKSSVKIDDIKNKKEFNEDSGWIDLNRIKVLIEPVDEWKQMFHEVWRLQRDHFWRENMSGVNWEQIYNHYLPLIDRVSCRREFGDLVWEMQGELGTSHCYDIGGDYRETPQYQIGILGADFKWEPVKQSYQLTSILKGPSLAAGKGAPLFQPGLNIKKGDYLLEINRQALSYKITPHERLLNKARQEVEIKIHHRATNETDIYHVKTLSQDRALRYHDWVENNREYIKTQTKNRVGYVHIPNMGPEGYSEFYRSYLKDYDHDGLIIDVRFNGGGMVSQLLLRQIIMERVGVDQSRWFKDKPYPELAPAGPMVALTNEYAGSDGDIFSHCFKLYKLGPLIGKRTWGGVIGINPQHFLVDGGITTQPEYSFWFKDVGWNVENYGTDPDIEIEIRPDEYRKGVDPQLERGIEEILTLLEKKPPFRPHLTDHPNLYHPLVFKSHKEK